MTGTGGTGGAGAGMPGCASASTRRVRRLSQREYLNVLTDLLGADLAGQAADMLPLEAPVAGFDNQSNALLVSSAFQEGLANVAEKLSSKVDAMVLAPCPTAVGSPACLETFARAFARKAYGRSPTEDEVQRLLTAAATGDSYANSVQLIVETVVQSPYLLYATELGPDAPVSAPTIALTPQEVASQLSLLLTGARPDDDLMRAADENRLSTRTDLTSAVVRLMATPRAKDQLQLLVKGWIDTGPVATAPKNPDTFPAFTPEVAAAMQEELDVFIDTKVAGGQGTFASLLSDTSAHIPAPLRAIYGADLVSQNGISVLDSKKRQGILSLPGVLTYHSADQHSGPIERGLLVRRQLFCQDVPAPPDSVLQRIAQNPIDPTDTAKTTRQKYEQHKTEAFCAACHDQFDAIGFGFEEMDGLGRFRTLENGHPVDSSGALSNTDVDGTFVGVAELSQKLAASGSFETCFVRQFFRFAESRVPESTEQCLVDDWAGKFVKSGGHFKDLIVIYVTEAGFITRKEDR
jgi:uncharacterized protein DUF1592/uncharacterized protein DUF1588/uncharacterized protein DUF1587/uncharacterized protein DUF1585/uncharacterized protein DUF1595